MDIEAPSFEVLFYSGSQQVLGIHWAFTTFDLMHGSLFRDQLTRISHEEFILLLII